MKVFHDLYSGIEKSGLAKKAAQKLLSFDLDRTWRDGFSFNQFEREFITTYPPLPVAKPLTEKEIFAMPRKKHSIALYVHIPFCPYVCGYCGRYAKFAKPSKAVVEKFLQAIRREFELAMRKPELQRGKISSIAFGGGTPTFLTEKQLKELAEFILERVDFKPSQEFCVEGTPDTLNEKMIETLYDLGVNRVAFGVQSFDDKILKICGRKHTGETAKNAIGNIRKIGIENINIDLMTSLPNQTIKSIENDANTIAEIQPKGVTVYYTYLQESCRLRYLKELNFVKPPLGLLFDQMLFERFDELGYKKDGLRYFSLHGATLTHQLSKWKSEEMLALGPGTYQWINNIQFYNHMKIQEYFKSIENNRLPVLAGFKLNKIEQMARYIIMGLRTPSVNKREFKERFGTNVEQLYEKELEELVEHDLIENNNKETKLTEKGILFSEEVRLRFYSKSVKRLLSKKGIKYCGHLFKPEKYY